MRAKMVVVLIAVGIAAAWIVPTATAQRVDPSWVYVCHRNVNLLIVGASAAAAHINHGDTWGAYPGGAPPCPA